MNSAPTLDLHGELGAYDLLGSVVDEPLVGKRGMARWRRSLDSVRGDKRENARLAFY